MTWQHDGERVAAAHMHNGGSHAQCSAAACHGGDRAAEAAGGTPSALVLLLAGMCIVLITHPEALSQLRVSDRSGLH
jgi:hypothetical protein